MQEVTLSKQVKRSSLLRSWCWFASRYAGVICSCSIVLQVLKCATQRRLNSISAAGFIKKSKTVLAILTVLPHYLFHCYT